MEDNVVLLDAWASTFATRVRIALVEKGIKYESREENLPDKSPLLLEMNPVHKKIPVLIHNGKPIWESLVIVQYIDEMWPNKSPLLPSDPYQRSLARFWADYVDKKIGVSGISIWRAKGEEHERAKVEFMAAMKILEGELQDSHILVVIDSECPKIVEWTTRCSEKDSVSKTLPDPEKIYDFVLILKQKFGSDLYI